MENTKIKQTEFNIGDEVLIKSQNTKGVIKAVTSYLGKGDNIYLVESGSKEKTVIESNLRLVRKNNINLNIDMNDLAIKFKIEDKIREIIDTLDLKKTEKASEQLLNACKLQAYLTIQEEYEDDTFKIGTSVTYNELYHGLVNGDIDFMINSYIFSEILSKVGMKVLTVAMKSEDGEFYTSNLVLINNEYYYFDVTLEMAVYEENGSNPDEFVLCCGALGKDSYEQFFKPLCILDFNNNLNSSILPKNISREDIDIDIVNKMLTIGLDENE